MDTTPDRGGRRHDRLTNDRRRDQGMEMADPHAGEESPEQAPPNGRTEAGTGDNPAQLTAGSGRADSNAVRVIPPDGWEDELTGVEGPRFWDRILAREHARVTRYRRPATVAFVELGGLEGLARQWGTDVAEQALRVCSASLTAQVRTSDYLARVDSARFGILLTETDEVAAINFVERARVATEAAVLPSAALVSIAFGWASPSAGGSLLDAGELALKRLAAELRGAGRG
jgi:diguanylate cyclase (GGDEF)-like protein